MRRPGPRRERANRRPLAAVALVAVLLLAANPALLLPSGEAAPASSAADSLRAEQHPCAGGCHLPGGLTLASIFPLGGDRRSPERSDPELVGLADERAGELFDALSSETARELLGHLATEPLTATELSERVDTSLQNVHYHLENLHEAGAIVETAVEYSERGREMSVYAAACEPQVVLYDLSE